MLKRWKATFLSLHMCNLLGWEDPWCSVLVCIQRCPQVIFYKSLNFVRKFSISIFPCNVEYTGTPWVLTQGKWEILLTILGIFLQKLYNYLIQFILYSPKSQISLRAFQSIQVAASSPHLWVHYHPISGCIIIPSLGALSSHLVF